ISNVITVRLSNTDPTTTTPPSLDAPALNVLPARRRSLAPTLIVTLAVLAAGGVLTATMRSHASRTSAETLSAYRAGRTEYRRDNGEAATRDFARALELDSTFAPAALDLV